MTCPGGCGNGGGQISTCSDNLTPIENVSILIPTEEDQVVKVYNEWVSSHENFRELHSLFNYSKSLIVESQTKSLNIDW